MKKKIIIGVLIGFVLVTSFVFFKVKLASKSVAQQAVAVSTVEAKATEMTTTVIADGSAVPVEEEVFKARINGMIKEILVEAGDQVQNGDKLIEFYDDSLEKELRIGELNLVEAEKSHEDLLLSYQEQSKVNQLKLAEAKYNLEVAFKSLEDKRIELLEEKEDLARKLSDAQESFEENEYLYENNAIAKKEFQRSEEDYLQLKEKYQRFIEETLPRALDLAELKVKDAKNRLELVKISTKRDGVTKNDLEVSALKVERRTAEIDNIKSKLEKRIVATTIPGTIIDLAVKPGDKVAEGTTVAKVASVTNLMVEAMVDEISIDEVKLGQNVVVSSEAFEQTFAGEVVKIAPTAIQDGNINKFKIEIDLKREHSILKPGMFVSCEIETNFKEKAIAVSPLAVLGEEQKFVYIVKDGIAEKGDVELGLKTLDKVEIKGIEPGSRVIIGPFTVLKNLRPGSPVRNMNSKM